MPHNIKCSQRVVYLALFESRATLLSVGLLPMPNSNLIKNSPQEMPKSDLHQGRGDCSSVNRRNASIQFHAAGWNNISGVLQSWIGDNSLKLQVRCLSLANKRDPTFLQDKTWTHVTRTTAETEWTEPIDFHLIRIFWKFFWQKQFRNDRVPGFIYGSMRLQWLSEIHHIYGIKFLDRRDARTGIMLAAPFASNNARFEQKYFK